MKEENKSQKAMILSHLKRFGSIEPLTALRDYGIYRLGARISDLRQDGYNIITETRQSVSRITGRPVRYADYKLKDNGSI